MYFCKKQHLMDPKKNITENAIISKFMDEVLMTGKKPVSIYKFAKELKIEERTFFEYFGSFEHLESQIFVRFFENSLDLLESSDEYKDYDSKNKLLSLYFTLFETFKANRSYISFCFKEHHESLKTLRTLTGIKVVFCNFIKGLELETIELKNDVFNKTQIKSQQEILWVQFLLILKFWLDDNSPSFEKTDIFIEKNIHAAFDIIHTKPVKSILDLGKFIFKEKMNVKV